MKIISLNNKGYDKLAGMRLEGVYQYIYIYIDMYMYFIVIRGP